MTSLQFHQTVPVSSATASCIPNIEIGEETVSKSMMADYVKFFASRLVLGAIEVKVNVPDIAIIAKGEGKEPFGIGMDGLDCLGVVLAQFACLVAFKYWACWVDGNDALHCRISSIPGTKIFFRFSILCQEL